MSLSFALSNAASGLRAQGRAAELVSGNVANALTPGYARRELALATDVSSAGGGVLVTGIDRVVDPVILADRRLAEADAGAAGALAGALETIETAIGDPTQPHSLTQRVARFSARLIEAASQPEAELRLVQAVDAARELAEGFNAVGGAIQDMRSRADTKIAELVERVNGAVAKVDALNDQIRRLGARSRNASVLQESRQQAIDSLAEILPVREAARADGTVALFTANGAVLLDGRARELAFEPRGIVAPWMRVEDGALSGLTIGGVAVETGSARSLLGRGALAAQFELRDAAGPEAQAALDALARDLVERYQDVALDPTLPLGPPPGPGLFVDGAGAFDATAPNAEEGLAQRLAINPAVDPSSGGAAFRLRDGLGAAAPGAPGDPALISALLDKLDEARAPASGPQVGQARGFSDQVALFLGGVAATRQARESEAAFAGARLEGLREVEAAGGVDTDDEMQKLLVIEQSYAANARVIEVVGDLMDRLMRL